MFPILYRLYKYIRLDFWLKPSRILRFSFCAEVQNYIFNAFKIAVARVFQLFVATYFDSVDTLLLTLNLRHIIITIS